MILPELKKVPGLRLATRRLHAGMENQYFYGFTPAADISTAQALLACIRETRALRFFDAEHPTISDFAAYIYMLRAPGEFLVQSMNHGWSTDWLPLTPAQAERYVCLCIPHNTVPDDAHISFYELAEPFKDRKIDRSQGSGLWQYLNERLKIRT